MDESALKALLASLEASRSTLHWWLEFWTILVVAGVALEIVFVVWEYVEEEHDFRRGIVHPPERPSRLLFFLGLLGAALVAIGVAGELYAESKIETAETGIRKANDELFSLLSKQAADAAASAKTAHEEADAVKNEADAIDIRLEAASRKLGDVEQETLAQGPRWRSLNKAAPELAKQLSRFAGQRAELFVCGRSGSQDGEMLETWGRIANILDSDVVSGIAGAKWKLVPTNLVFFERGCSPGGGQPLGQGIVFFVSKRASKTTMDAAKALSEGIIKALPPSPTNALSVIDPDFSQKFTQPIEGKDTPWAMAANDPGLITVLIGAHPQQEATSKTKAKAKSNR
jgi:hypothetical protein